MLGKDSRHACWCSSIVIFLNSCHDSDIGTTIFHPVGTCKMGDPDRDPTSVVDSKLKICGISGVRIADASVMPRITSGNTAAPTMVIAEKCFRMIIAEEDAR